MIIKEQKPIIFDNQCGCLFDSNLLSEALIWYFYPRPIYHKKRITLWRGYPAVTARNVTLHVHRLLGLYSLLKKIVSGRTSKSLVIHHKDNNVLNCQIYNLEVKLYGEHISKHLKGKGFTTEHRAGIGEANRRRKGMKMKKKYEMSDLKNLLDSGLSINKISQIYGCDWSTVKNRINENPELLK